MFSEMNILFIENKKKAENDKWLLEILGCEVEIYNNVLEALNFLKSHENFFDVIFIDSEMPKLNGIEFTKKLRKWEKEADVKQTPIIIISANS